MFVHLCGSVESSIAKQKLHRCASDSKYGCGIQSQLVWENPEIYCMCVRMCGGVDLNGPVVVSDTLRHLQALPCEPPISV